MDIHAVNLNAKHKHEFTETKGHLYEVTLTAMVEVAFDSTPTEKELRVALVDNAIEHMENLLDTDQDELVTRDLTYTHVDEVPLI